MAISAAGIGSGLDIASIINQLVAAERTPEATRIANATGKYTTQLSSLGSLTGALSSLQDKVKALSGNAMEGGFKATSSKTDVFTATANSSAVAGSYDVEVVSLAKADRQASIAYVGGADTVLGNGDVEISVGGEAFTVTLADGANTLGDLRDAINAASDNTGVRATLINEVDGSRLVLTSTKTGNDTGITVTSPLVTMDAGVAHTAADAHVVIGGFDVYSSTNTVSGAVDGITFTLLSEAPGDAGKLTVAADNSKAQSAIQAFVTAFNSVVNVVKSLTAYNAETRTASPFTGDAAVRGALHSLRDIMSGVVEGGEFTTLSALGITTSKDGTLSVNNTTLSEALSEDPDAVAALFSGEKGIATRLTTALSGLIGTDGSLTSKTGALNRRLKDLGEDTDELERRIENYQTRLTAQYSRLDALLAQMNATSSGLQQQLASLAKMT